MAIVKDAAFVLKRIPLRESSLLITLLSRESGKLKVVAKGVRKEKNPTTVRFEPFTNLSIVYYEKTHSDIHILSQAAILDTNAHLRERLDWFGFGSFMAELVDAVLSTHDSHPEIYDLLAEAFSEFPNGNGAMIMRAFEIKLLALIGFLPELSQCASCGQRELAEVFFSARQGGILCRGCEAKETRALPISKRALESLHFCLNEPLNRIAQLTPDLSLGREFDRIGDEFINFRLDHHLRSRRFLSEIQGFLKN